MATATAPSAGHVSGQSNRPLSLPAHSLPSDQVCRELESDAGQGLTADDAARRIADLGPNQLDGKGGVNALAIFLEQIFNAMTLVLLLALGASFGMRAWYEGGMLAAIIVLNIVIGFLQSFHAEKTIDSLRTLASPTCNVLRDGDVATIKTVDVVPGDIVYLSTGDSVPADIRLVEAVNLEADEALLTGESSPVAKDPRLTFDEDTGPADRLNVAYSSTTITKGRGHGVVFATAMFTEIGLIASALNGGRDEKGIPEERKTPLTLLRRACHATVQWLGDFLGLTQGTPLQRKLAQLFLYLFAFAILCAIIVLGANSFDARQDVVLYAVTTAIGTIPVSLLLVLTLTMAAGTKKMIKRHVIVRNLQSLEALGGVTNICSDKTGTITQGRMIVRKAWLPGCGTYSVEAGSDVYDPTMGQVTFSPGEPKHHLAETDEPKYPAETDEPKHLAETDEPKHLAETDKAQAPIAPLDEAAARPPLQWYLNVASLANLATLDKMEDQSTKTGTAWKARGAPTEVAIEVFAGRFGWNRVQLSQGPEARWTHVAEFPFDSDVKKMSVLFRDAQSQQVHVLTKGAVERVLDSCDRIAVNESIQSLTEEARIGILTNMESLASQGLRVLALAHKAFHGSVSEPDFLRANAPSRDLFERSLIFCGLIGIYDPPRPESLPSVRRCQGAGIVVHMLTGDHPQTARAIAAEVNIMPSPDQLRLLPADVAGSMVMTAQQFDSLTNDQIDALPQLPLVVARCAPSTKVRMIEALHRRGRYVAMTGDGVNDSPSLKRADIGIAMGTGSDVAKNSSDIILTDDNFASILNAIEEGRRIFDNIQKFILHVLAANIGFVVSLLIGLAFKDETGVSVFLLTPIEILWMLMGTGAFCETGLGYEKAVPDILNRPPHNLRFGVFSPEFLLDMLAYGALMACCTIGSFTVVIFGFGDGNLGIGCNNEYSAACDDVFRARATCYTTMTWIFLLFAWELIDARRSFLYMPAGPRAWAGHLWGNKLLFFSVTIVFAVVFATLYIPYLNHDIFLHTGISWEWAVVFVAVAVFMLGAEAWKAAKRAYVGRRVPAPRIGWDDADDARMYSV